MTESVLFQARDLGYTYPRPSVAALENLSCSARSGTITAVMGPNGSGKTTFLRLLMGLLAPTTGTLEFMGYSPSESPEAVRRSVGYVPQHDSINLRLPVGCIEIVALGIASRTGERYGSSRVRKRAREALDVLGIESIAELPYNRLSGGQRQRVLIARALAVDPSVLVLDEPFRAMDMASQQATTEFLGRVVRDREMSVISVVHNVNALVHFIDEILLLNRELVASGHPDEILRPELLRKAYGADVPVAMCEEGHPHPLMEDAHV
jgi:zinc/manganese transport system ATP-binding protein